MSSKQGFNWPQCSSIEPIKSIIDYNLFRTVMTVIFFTVLAGKIAFPSSQVTYHPNEQLLMESDH